MGCAVRPEKLENDAEYASLVGQQVNLLVAENAMKWRDLRPTPGTFDFRAADEVVAFASAHRQRVRGHNLCWHKALPDWFAATATRANARQIFTNHIQTVVSHFAGHIHSWDVVNEPLDLKDGRADGLRQAPWLDLIGDDYIELAFRTAKEADPTALLTLNEAGIQHDTKAQRDKRDRLFDLLKRLKKRGVPIDAVGIESHLATTGPQPGSGVRDFVRDVRKLEMQVFLTEVDVSDQFTDGSDAQRDVAVARVYKDYLSTMLAEPNVTVLVTWGITDRYTALSKPEYERRDEKPQRPLPFDASCQPVPAFFAVRDAIDRHQFGKA